MEVVVVVVVCTYVDPFTNTLAASNDRDCLPEYVDTTAVLASMACLNVS